MRSGIIPESEVLTEFNLLKKDRKLKTMIFEITEDSKLQCVFRGDNNFSYKDLFDKLPSEEPRYIAYDFDYPSDEKPLPRKCNKLILILWCPQDAPAKKKFLYSSSVAEIATTLGSIQKTFQVDDFSGMDYDEIRNQLLKS